MLTDGDVFRRDFAHRSLRAFPYKEPDIPHFSPAAMRSLCRLSFIMLGCTVPACHATHVRTQPAQMTDMNGSSALVRLRDGSSVALRHAIVTPDSLVGTMASSDSVRVAIPMSAVAGVEEREFDPLRTVIAVVAGGLAALVALLLLAQSTLPPG